MFAINVQETTTTVGLSNIILEGSSEFGRTFTSQYDTNERFPYYIDDRAGNWEHGLGYLSDATTLVREYLIDSSTGAFVDFAAGEKQVFVGTSGANNIKNAAGFLGTLGGLNICKPDNVVSAINRNTTANSIIYIPQLYHREMTIDLLGVVIASGATASNMYLGIYEHDPATGKPGTLITETSVTTTSTGLVSGTLSSEVKVQAGWTWFALWCDVATISLRSSSGTTLISNPFAQSSNALGNVLIHGAQTGLTSLPGVAAPTLLSGAGSSFNYVMVGHT